MKSSIYRLIRNGRPYKRYYYQPLLKDTVFHRVRLEFNIVWGGARAIYLPFNKKYNAQQFIGERKPKWKMVLDNLLRTLKYKEVCWYYFLYGLDLKSRSPKDYIAYTEFRVLRNILNFRCRESCRTLYTFNYLGWFYKLLFYDFGVCFE